MIGWETIPPFEVIGETFVISSGAVTPTFECASDDDARLAMHSLNELLERADRLRTESARAIAALTAERDAMKDESDAAFKSIDRASEMLLKIRGESAGLREETKRLRDALNEIRLRVSLAVAEPSGALMEVEGIAVAALATKGGVS